MLGVGCGGGSVLQCPEVGDTRRRASEVEKNQERVGSWKPSEECSREGVNSYFKILLIEQVIR